MRVLPLGEYLTEQLPSLEQHLLSESLFNLENSPTGIVGNCRCKLRVLYYVACCIVACVTVISMVGSHNNHRNLPGLNRPEFNEITYWVKRFVSTQVCDSCCCFTS